MVKGKPIVLMTASGSDPSLSSLLLNSHTDVVPVTFEKWSFDPFGAEVADGKIYARGSQDMKSVGMAYLSAIKELKKSARGLKRTIHLSFVPDEEIGGTDGMKAFVESECFRSLNIGYVLDEGIPCPFDSLLLFNDERVPWCT